jgi:hypothetical protein
MSFGRPQHLKFQSKKMDSIKFELTKKRKINEINENFNSN